MERAKQILRTQTLEALVEQFELTSESTEDFRAVVQVRGWLLDELEARNSEAFEAWMLTEKPVDSPREFFL